MTEVVYQLERLGRGDLVDRFEAPEDDFPVGQYVLLPFVPYARARGILDVKLARLTEMVRELEDEAQAA